MINGDRLLQQLQDLSRIGRNEATGGIHRFSFTQEEKQTIELVTTYMEQSGMSVTIDVVGNLIGPMVMEMKRLCWVPTLGFAFTPLIDVLPICSIPKTANPITSRILFFSSKIVLSNLNYTQTIPLQNFPSDAHLAFFGISLL